MQHNINNNNINNENLEKLNYPKLMSELNHQSLLASSDKSLGPVPSLPDLDLVWSTFDSCLFDYCGFVFS